jgi:hypothetical protein
MQTTIEQKNLAMENPIIFHRQQIKESAFGDSRLEKRGSICMKQ